MEIYASEFLGLLRDSQYSDHVAGIERCINDFDQDLYAVLGYQLFVMEQPTGERHNLDRRSIVQQGRMYFENVKVEIGKVVCGKDYGKDRERVKALIIGGMPALLKALNMPIEAAGIVAVCILIVLKIGIRSFCRSLNETKTPK